MDEVRIALGPRAESDLDRIRAVLDGAGLAHELGDERPSPTTLRTLFDQAFRFGR